MTPVTLKTPDDELQDSPPETVAQKWIKWGKAKLRAGWTPAHSTMEEQAALDNIDHVSMVEWKRQFAVIAKHKDQPIVRNYLWSIGMKPSAEEALGFVKDKIAQDPKFAKQSIGFRFYAVEVGRHLEVQVDYSTGVIFGVEKW